MKRLLTGLSALTLAVAQAFAAAPPAYFVDETKLPFTSLPGLPAQQLWGVHNGAGYRVEVPANWNAGTNNQPSIVRISSSDGSCAFSTSGGNPTPVAEPGGVPLLAAGLALLAMNRRRRAVATATAGIAHLSIPRRLQ